MKAIKCIERFGKYLDKNKNKVIVMPQKQYKKLLLNKITTENTYEHLKNYLENKYGIKTTWEYGDNYITFSK